MKQEVGLHTLNQSHGKQSSLLHKPPSLGCYVTAALRVELGRSLEEFDEDQGKPKFHLTTQLSHLSPSQPQKILKEAWKTVAKRASKCLYQ